MLDLLSCITKKFSGYEIVTSECENEEKTLFTPTSILFDPVKHHKYKIDCYFSTEKHLVYRALMSGGKSGTARHSGTFKCYYCSTYLA